MGKSGGGDRWPLSDEQELSTAEGVLGERQPGRERPGLNNDAIFNFAAGGTSPSHWPSDDLPDIGDQENMKRWAKYRWPTTPR